MNPTSKKSINPFLETIARSSSAAADETPAEKATIPIKLIGLIAAGSSGTTPVARLLEQSNMGVAEFAQALTAIQSAGLIELKGTGPSQIAELTDVGAKLASIV